MSPPYARYARSQLNLLAPAHGCDLRKYFVDESLQSCSGILAELLSDYCAADCNGREFREVAHAPSDLNASVGALHIYRIASDKRRREPFCDEETYPPSVSTVPRSVPESDHLGLNRRTLIWPDLCRRRI